MSQRSRALTVSIGKGRLSEKRIRCCVDDERSSRVYLFIIDPRKYCEGVYLQHQYIYFPRTSALSLE